MSMKKDMKTKNNSENTFSWKEITCYVISGLITMFGLILMVLHLVARFSNENANTNPLKIAENNLMQAMNVPINFLGYGLIFFSLGIVILIITLAVNAKKTDRIIEKEMRRQQRLASSLIDEGQDKIIEAEIVKNEDEVTPTLTAKEQ